MTIAESVERPVAQSPAPAAQATHESHAVRGAATRILKEAHRLRATTSGGLASDRGELPPVDCSLLGEIDLRPGTSS